MRRLLLAAIFLILVGCARPPREFKVAKCTHSIGLCNLAMFILKEDQTTTPYGVSVELIDIPNWADHPAALAGGTVDFSVTPFTNVLTAYANGAPIKIIAGSGINGLHLLSSKNIKEPSDLRNRRIGTFRADTLELMLLGYLKNSGIPYQDVKVEYFTDGTEMLQAFAAGRLDAITHVEPYATKAVRELGARRLTSGEAVWEGNHPDCVLTASDRIIKDEPDIVRAVIAGMMRAEGTIEGNLDLSLMKVVGKYYKTEMIDLKQAAHSQPPGIDIRDRERFMTDRFNDLRELNYITSIPSESVVDFSFLEQVIKEHPDLYHPLLVKAENLQSR